MCYDKKKTCQEIKGSDEMNVKTSDENKPNMVVNLSNEHSQDKN